MQSLLSFPLQRNRKYVYVRIIDKFLKYSPVPWRLKAFLVPDTGSIVIQSTAPLIIMCFSVRYLTCIKNGLSFVICFSLSFSFEIVSSNLVTNLSICLYFKNFKSKMGLSPVPSSVVIRKRTIPNETTRVPWQDTA